MRRADKVLEQMEWGVMQDCSDYHPRNNIPASLRAKRAAMAAREAFDEDRRGGVVLVYMVMAISGGVAGFCLREIVRLIF